MSVYFWNGFYHFIAAVILTILFNRIAGGDRFKSPLYWVSLVFTSSALFFVPLHIDYYGAFYDKIYQFIHYPFPDWDILTMGMEWHRNFVTHSLLLPLVLMIILNKRKECDPFVTGAFIGMSSHFMWDCISGSIDCAIVFIPGMYEIVGRAAKIWLEANGIILFLIAYFKR